MSFFECIETMLMPVWQNLTLLHLCVMVMRGNKYGLIFCLLLSLTHVIKFTFSLPNQTYNISSNVWKKWKSSYFCVIFKSKHQGYCHVEVTSRSTDEKFKYHLLNLNLPCTGPFFIEVRFVIYFFNSCKHTIDQLIILW